MRFGWRGGARARLGPPLDPPPRRPPPPPPISFSLSILLLTVHDARLGQHLLQVAHGLGDGGRAGPALAVLAAGFEGLGLVALIKDEGAIKVFGLTRRRRGGRPGDHLVQAVQLLGAPPLPGQGGVGHEQDAVRLGPRLGRLIRAVENGHGRPPRAARTAAGSAAKQGGLAAGRGGRGQGPHVPLRVGLQVPADRDPDRAGGVGGRRAARRSGPLDADQVDQGGRRHLAPFTHARAVAQQEARPPAPGEEGLMLGARVQDALHLQLAQRPRGDAGSQCVCDGVRDGGGDGGQVDGAGKKKGWTSAEVQGGRGRAKERSSRLACSGGVARETSDLLFSLSLSLSFLLTSS